ncbi:MAG: PaaI family thioesterase [Schleiferiaceae bacterium]
MTQEEAVKRLNAFTPNTLMHTLEMSFTGVSEDFMTVTATMPVTPRVHQPMGLLHGGATAALVETLGSASSFLHLPKDRAAVGIELQCNHVRSIKEGRVIATGTLEHKGGRMHVWSVRVEDEAGRLISLCKLTNMIISSSEK